MSGGRDVLIAGGGVAGMATALALARAGREVTLLERDDAAPATTPEDAFAVPRRGVPQLRQTHCLLARLTQVLRSRFPDLIDELLGAGATEAPLALPGPAEDGDDEIAVLLVRRTTLEWVLRRAVARQDGVEVRGRSTAAGLITGPPGTVAGVFLTDGTEIPASTVVVSTGARGDLPGWLADLGVMLEEKVRPAELVYLTRWYRTPDPHAARTTSGPGPSAPAAGRSGPGVTGDIGYLRYIAVPCDGGMLSVTLAVPSRDPELRRHLTDPGHFDDAAARLPRLAGVFTDRSLTPISGVEPMTGFVNRLRRFVDDEGRPLVLGLHAVGDAHTCTNPFYGRGCSLALVQSALLADAFAGHDDAADRAVGYERACAAQIEPWFDHSVMLDTVFDPAGRRERRVSRDGGVDPAPAIRALILAGETDPVLARGLLRVFNLLTRPDELMSDPEFAMAAAAAVTASAGSPPARERTGPRRHELLGLHPGDETDD